MSDLSTQSDREPWLAASWSSALPGLGHAYLGRRHHALVWLGATLTLAALSVLFILHPRLPVWPGYVLLVAAIAMFIAATVSAYRTARRIRLDAGAPVPGPDHRASLGVFLNAVVPGVGHFVTQQVGMGIVLVALALMCLVFPEPWQEFGWAVLAAVAIWHGWRALHAGASLWPRPVTSLAGWHLGLSVAAVILLWSVRVHAVQAYRVPAGSLEPAIERGDRIYVEKIARHDLRPGEIVAFPFPPDPSKTFLKRVLGLPGDVVEFRADGAYRNGALVIPYTARPEQAGWADRTDILGHPSQPFQVPEGTVFLVGDDLANSNDSRYFGPIPIADVAGRAYRIYWPLSRAGTIPAGFPVDASHARTTDRP